MAELVIDWLKAVQIDKSQTNCRGVLASQVESISRLGFKQSAIRKPGEMIMLKRRHIRVHNNGANSFV